MNIVIEAVITTTKRRTISIDIVEIDDLIAFDDELKVGTIVDAGLVVGTTAGSVVDRLRVGTTVGATVDELRVGIEVVSEVKGLNDRLGCAVCWLVGWYDCNIDGCPYGWIIDRKVGRIVVKDAGVGFVAIRNADGTVVVGNDVGWLVVVANDDELTVLVRFIDG